MFRTPLIFYGPDYETALSKAKEFGFNLLNKEVSHPDFLEIIPEGKNYTKEQITDFLSDVALSPYSSPYKVYLFHKADKMLPVHANALLKTFEEKPDHAVILLVTDNVKAIIETILSRSKKIFVPNSAQETVSNSDALVRQALKSRAENNIYACLDILPELELVPLEEISDSLLNWYRDNKPRALEAVCKLVEKAHVAHDRHMRSKLILEYLFLQPLSL